MKKILFLVLAILDLVSICQAEPRWCSVTGQDPSNVLVYPPIFVAARISGVVVSRIIYMPNGKVEKVEQVFGAPMLSTYLSSAMMKWIVKTDAVGDQPCETLVIAKFTLHDPTGRGPEEFRFIAEGSILQLSISRQFAEQFVDYSYQESRDR